MESLNLTIAESQEPREYQPKLFNDEQRKLYRDDITPLTDEEKKALQASISGIGCALFLIVVTAVAIGGLFLYYADDSRTFVQCSSMAAIGAAIVFLVYWHGNRNTRKELAANRKRIIIAPALHLFSRTKGSGLGNSTKHIQITFSTKDEIKEDVLETLIDLEERDMVEMHRIFRPDGSTRLALRPTKVVAFKREKSEIKDLQRQMFFKDEIVPLTDEDRGKIKQKMNFNTGCAVFFVIPPTAFAVYWFFFSANQTVWRFVFGGIGFLVAVLFVLGWLLSRYGRSDELKNNQKRVIVAPVTELTKKTILGKPTKFYAHIRTGAEIVEREIPAETYLDLKAGDIVELQITHNPGGDTTTLQEVTKIADAPEETPLDAESTEV